MRIIALKQSSVLLRQIFFNKLLLKIYFLSGLTKIDDLLNIKKKWENNYIQLN
jgi:hypothetical protein